MFLAFIAKGWRLLVLLAFNIENNVTVLIEQRDWFVLCSRCAA